MYDADKSGLSKVKAILFVSFFASANALSNGEKFGNNKVFRRAVTKVTLSDFCGIRV